jgi:hypothetical protein
MDLTFNTIVDLSPTGKATVLWRQRTQTSG